MKRLFFLPIVVHAFLAAAAPAALEAGSTDGTATAVFLRMEQGARAMGMGGAFISLPRDVEAIWWNPAGATALLGPQLNAGFSYLFEDMSNSYVAFALPLGEAKTSSLLGGINYLSMGTVDARDAVGNAQSSIVPFAVVGSVGYAVTAGQNVSLGLLAKSVQQNFGETKSAGIAFDAGVQVRLLPELIAGIAAQNLGPKLKTEEYENKLPMNIRGGVSYIVLSRITVALDAERPADADSFIHFGTEVKMSETVFVRAGYNTNTAAGFTLGVGLLTPISLEGAQTRIDSEDWEHNAVRIDYAFVSSGNIDSTHRVSLALRL